MTSKVELPFALENVYIGSSVYVPEIFHLILQVILLVVATKKSITLFYTLYSMRVWNVQREMGV